jgi:WD40 repeat protein
MADPAKPAIDPEKTWQEKELKHDSPLIGARFEPRGRFVFTGAQDNAVLRWEVETGKKTVLAGHKSWVRALAFAAKERWLFSGDYNGKILVWPIDAETPKPERTIDAHRGWVRALAVSPDGKTLASAGNDNLVKLWSVADGKLIRELVGHGSQVYNLAFHPDGRQLASIEHKSIIKHWDLTTGQSVRDLDAQVLFKYDPTFRAEIGGARGMTFSPDGTMLACSGISEVTNAFAGIGKPLVLLYDWAGGKLKQSLKPRDAFQGTAWGVVFHPAGFLAAVGGGNGGALWFWKPDQQLSFFTLKLPNNARDLDLDADGRRLAIPFFDGAVRIYDMTPKSPGKPAVSKPAK